MAKQGFGFKIKKGSIGDLTFSKNGNTVGMKSSLSGARVKNAPEFARTRENMSEFGRAASISAAIFRGSKTSPKLRGKVTATVLAAIKRDSSNMRGQRNVTESNIASIIGINAGQTIQGITNVAPIFSEDQTTVTLPNFNPQGVVLPTNWHHLQFRLTVVGQDEEGNNVHFVSEPVNIHRLQPIGDVVIDLPPLYSVNPPPGGWRALVADMMTWDPQNFGPHGYDGWENQTYDPDWETVVAAVPESYRSFNQQQTVKEIIAAWIPTP